MPQVLFVHPSPVKQEESKSTSSPTQVLFVHPQAKQEEETKTSIQVQKVFTSVERNYVFLRMMKVISDSVVPGRWLADMVFNYSMTSNECDII